MKREGLMLAKQFKNQLIGGWYCSEKLDGERCFWDGGITRGMQAHLVPWAWKPKPGSVATGLWTRNFKIIFAPDSWVAQLPTGVCLDGELYTQRGDFQNLISIVRREIPNSDWNNVKYCIFDSPNLRDVLSPGRMRIRGEDFQINCFEFVLNLNLNLKQIQTQSYSFNESVVKIQDFKNEVIEPLAQIKLPDNNVSARIQIYELLADVLQQGGEGLMLRAPRSFWCPKRVESLLKFKEFNDTEGVVIGYQEGKGRHLSRLGALILSWNDKTLEIGSGFTDSDRDNYLSLFPIGSEISFRYTGLTDSGVPRHASFFRRKNEEEKNDEETRVY